MVDEHILSGEILVELDGGLQCTYITFTHLGPLCTDRFAKDSLTEL